MIPKRPTRTTPSRTQSQTRRFAQHTALLAYFVMLLNAATAAGEVVEISGGQLPDNAFLWVWKITNHGSSPLVYLEMPHYRGDQFDYPRNRFHEDITNRTQTGMTELPGVFKLTAPSPAAGLQPDETMTVAIKVSARGAFPRPKKVKAKLADGTTVAIEGVDCPSQQGLFERNAALIAMSAIFLGFLAYQYLKSRRARGQIPDTAAHD